MRRLNCRVVETGDRVRLLAAIAIVAVTSIPVVASFIRHSSAATFMPEWNERQLAEMRR